MYANFWFQFYMQVSAVQNDIQFSLSESSPVSIFRLQIRD